MPEISPYGSWKSPLSAEKLAEKGVRYGHMVVDQKALYWLEVRANEQGRGVLIKCDANGNTEEVLAKDVSVRTKVHEYGSGDFIVSQGVVYFSRADDQCIYRFDGKLEQLTTVGVNQEHRYADYCLSANQQYLICVRETHHKSGVSNELVCLDLNNRNDSGYAKVRVLQSGYDFYSYPRISPNGNRIAWTCWNQPQMPWDAAELWLADFHKDGSVDAAHKVAGGIDQSALEAKVVESAEDSAGHQNSAKLQSNSSSIDPWAMNAVSQPCWSDDGILHYISDASGWTNLYSCRDGLLNALTPIDREFGIPQWVLASSTYTFATNSQIYAVYIQQGQQQLCHIDELTGHIEPIPLPFKDFGEHLLYADGHLYFRAAGPAVSEAIYSFNLETQACVRLSQAREFPLAVEELSIAETIEFESSNSRISHGFYYAPHNTQYQAPEKTAPPLIVMSHGGPTAMTQNSLNAAIQFWTHRGFAVVDVNYAGSTGYGKRYRTALNGQWGIVDVEDCIAAANYLVEKKLADPKALLIRGGSAGGYTTLCGLTFHDVFAAGMSRYGVADLESLASDSHKFEARYLDSVVGPYPEMKDVYIERSPIHSTDKLSCPILLLQGEDDKVVPPNQAEMMVAALREKQIPFAYQLYPGEGHGFRKSETIISALNAELSFYRQILNIKDAENTPQVEIYFLK
jgi:dipeptidyl aminopeptidase/acylaminoacyl peptidase